MTQLRFRPLALTCSLAWLVSLALIQAPSGAIAQVQAAAPASSAAPAQLSAAQLQAASAANEKGPPVMHEAAQLVATSGAHSKQAAPSTGRVVSVSNPRLFREVFGFAFASSLGDPTIGYPSWNFSLLSTVAYFGVHVAWNGNLVGDSGMAIWNDPNGPTPGFISTAHANGTKVVLTIIMQDSTPGTPDMCSALRYNAATIRQTVAQVAAKHVDGVNVDYESNNVTCPASGANPATSSQSLFTGFVHDLRAALPAGSYLSLDSYSGSAGYRSGTTYYGFFDVTALAAYVDAFFVMAYDMEYSNAYAEPLNCASFCIGPTAPLSTYLYNDSRASSEYRAVVPPSKVIMGIPYYGRKVCVSGYNPTNAPPNAVASGSAAADGYLDASTELGYSANGDYHIHRDVNDSAGQTRWDTFTSSTAGCTREMYWDDTVSLGDKYSLIVRDGLRGAGIFALNYGGGAPELWSLLLRKFGQCSNASIAADHTSPQIPGTLVTFNSTAVCAGNPEFRFWTAPPGGAWTVAQAYSPSATFAWDTTGKPLGTYRAEADARNQGSTVDHDTAANMLMRLALCVTPTLTPDHPSPQLTGTTITFTAAVTCSGTPQYRFWMQNPGGAWTIVQDYGPSNTLTWNTTGLALGGYNLEVDVRTAGTSVSYESVLPMTYSLTSCINTSLTLDKASAQPTGTTVNLTAAATCSGTSQFRFWMRPPGGAWTIAQDYGGPNTFTWNAQNPAGDYGLEVDAKSAADAATFMVPSSTTFTVTACSGAGLATSVGAPQVPGASITLTGSATCTGTAQYEFLTQAPGGAWSVAQPYGAATTFAWNTTGLATGVYGLEVEARNAGSTAGYETAADVNYVLANPACTAPALTPNVASPQASGSHVTFTATSATCPSPTYRFWVQPPGGSWTVAQDYSGLATFAWDASGVPGTWGVEVDVRDASRAIVNYDAVANTTYTLTGCTAATIAVNPASPQAPGVPVAVTGSATCPGTPEYRFWVQAPGAAWSMARDYSGVATFTWNSTTPSGVWALEVDVRDTGSTAAYQATSTTAYTVTGPCTTPALTPTPAGPQQAGTPVTFTAATTACPNPEYRFWMRPPRGAWSIVQDYSTNAAFSWSGGSAVGAYGVEVDVRNHGSSVVYDAVTVLSYVVSPVPPCTGATIAGNPASPVGTGASVTFTGTATGCSAAQYRFWELDPGSRWSMVRNYATASTFVWPGGRAPGTYRFEVDVRSAGSTAIYDAVGTATYAIATCTAATLGADHASPQPSGTAVVFTGAATCAGTPEYRFWVKWPGGVWTVVQDYGPGATLSWATTGLAPGTYDIEVDVRDAGSTAAYETVANTTFTLS